MATPPTLQSFDLNLLLLFDILHRERKLSTAAALVGLSQPAASQALSRLREAFDDALFVRRGSVMEPTAIANTLAPMVRTAMASLERGLTAVRTFTPESSERVFRLGLGELGEIVVLPEIVSHVATVAPHVIISSVRGTKRELELVAASGGVDLAIDFEPPTDPFLRCELVAEEELVVIASLEHPRLRGAISAEEFLTERHVKVDIPQPIRKRIEQVLNAPFLPLLKTGCICAHYSSLPAVVMATDSIGAVPRRLVGTSLFAGRVQVLELPFPNIKLPVYFWWHQSLDTDFGLSWLRTLLIEHFWRE